MRRTALSRIRDCLRWPAVAATTGTLLVLAQPGGGSAAAASRSALEIRVLDRVNDARHARGLRALRPSAALARAARAHARAMAQHGFFSHFSRNGASATQRIARYYGSGGSWTVGETLLWRSPGVTPSQSVRLWLASPPHRRVLLRPAFRELGVAAVRVASAPGVYGGRRVTILVADLGARG